MKLQDFDYTLPAGLIAQYPLLQRDSARLMVIDRARKKIVHDTFSRLAEYVPDSSMLVMNDTKVVPARLLGHRQTGGQVEVFLLNRCGDGYSYQALLRPLRRIKIDEKIFFNGSSIYAQLKDEKNRIVRFNKKDIGAHLGKIGHMPLPPYIKRPDERIDRSHYQTVYARYSGSVAAPTAGLHFTRPLLAQLKKKGHDIRTLTLHINYATFKPVEAVDITAHRMHSEQYEITRATYAAVMRHKKAEKKVVAVGTTSCRVLETVALTKCFAGSTDIFMYPGYCFQLVDCLVTNFHLPRSTLLMLVSAFAGHNMIMRAYREAIKRRYRFYSYGDCMLIL